METFIDLCRKFPWSWKIKASYKRLVNNKDNEKETRNEMEKILLRSVRYVGRSIQSPETVADLEGIIEFLEMLILNLNAFNTELSEEFPNFDDRILPLLEKYSELLVYRSKQTGLEVESMQRMYSFLQGLSTHKDHKISADARNKKLLGQLISIIKASTPAPKIPITGDKQEEINNNIETVESALEVSITNDKEEEINNNIETVESCSGKHVRFAETSPKRIDPIEWDTPEPSPGNGHQASSSTDSGGADAATNKDERNQSDDTSSNSSSTTSVRGERTKEDGETEQESNSGYHSLEPNVTIIRKEEDSSEDEEKGGTKRKYYSLEPCYSIPEEKKSRSPAIFDLSSDDEYDKESLTPLESIIESLASTPKNNSEFRRQLFAKTKKDADSSKFVKPALPVHKRRILSSESSNEDGPAAKQSTSKEATFLRPAVQVPQLHSDSDSTMGEITLKVTSTPVIEPTRPQQMPEQVELSDARRIIPESPLKGEGSARVLGVAGISEITPIISSSESFAFPGVPSSLTPTPAAASSPKAGSSISTASSNTVPLSVASSSTEKLPSPAPSPTSTASSSTAKLPSVTASTSTAELSPKTKSTASSSTSKLPSNNGSTTAAELPTSSASSSGTARSNFFVSQSPGEPKMKESALVATAKWVVENQPVVGGNSPATAAVELRPKVMKALSRSVRERRLRSSQWNVSDFKTPSPNRLVPDKTSSAIKNGLSHKMIPAADTEQTPPRPVTITLNKLKRSMEGNLLGCDASISDAEILEEIESSVNRSGGSDEDPSKPVDFGQEDGDAPGDNLALLSAFDNNALEEPSVKKGNKPSGKGTSPVEQERRRSPRLTGQPYFYVPLEITRKKEPLPGTSTSTASKRKLTAAAPDSEEIVPAKKVVTASKRRLTMAPSPKPITEGNSPPLIPITWEEVRRQLPPCWASLIDQHVRDTGRENNLMYREGTPTLRLKVYCPCTPHIGQSIHKS